jgi:hypothetical protein
MPSSRSSLAKSRPKAFCSSAWAVRAARDGFSRADGGLHELVRRKHAIDQPDALRQLGLDRLAAEHELLRPGDAHAPRQAARAAEARNDAQLDLGLTEARLLGGVDPVAGAGQLAAAAQGVAVHGRDAGDGQFLQRREHPMPEAAEGFRLLGREAAHLRDVGARGEGASRPRDHYSGCLARAGDRLLERRQRRAIQGIECVRSVECEDGDRSAALRANSLHGNRP